MISLLIFILYSVGISYGVDNDTITLKCKQCKKFEPCWANLDTRILPKWYDEAKIGIFVHWGIYSVPGFSEWFWNNWDEKERIIQKFMSNHYAPGFTYQDFAPMFKAEFFDPNKWAHLFVKAGVRYVVLTTKHHDGFCMFPSRRSFSWNSCAVGPKMDVVAELSNAVKQVGLKFGVYHSLFEWFNPMFKEDKRNHFKTLYYSNMKLWPELKQLVIDYKPSLLWADGDWEAYDTYWRSTEFLTWLYNDSPVKEEIVVNDRWGKGISCKHGDFYNCKDRYNPGKLQPHKWENAFTVDKKSWGFRKTMNANDTLTMKEILHEVASSVSCGGNVLINVGPTQYGTIPPIFQDRLLKLGHWLEINGQAIYGSSPWHYQNDSINPDVWYTCQKIPYNAIYPTAKPLLTDTVSKIFAIFLTWPISNRILLKDVTGYILTSVYEIVLLGNDGDLPREVKNGLTYIKLPDKATVAVEYAWVLKFTPK
ncbi:PREDICTED: tissue alpha-L-fucosidase-like [Papilio polytes]|uniref:tissue alpha-L-fucosidase-like n=1 Tax=Papilio polytes TaxID=76194 RepID=UPI000676929B|nr:PREDICTED: tissue alpha-L-fucosidase-like [Papilio polytes]